MKLKRSLFVTVLAGVILAGAGCGAAKDTVKQHLEALRSGNIEQAYSYVATGAQNTLTLETFRALVKNTPPLLQYKDSSFNEISIINNTGSVKGSVTGTDGSRVAAEYQMIEENGQWKITNIFINGQAPQPDQLQVNKDTQIIEEITLEETEMYSIPEESLTSPEETLQLVRKGTTEVGWNMTFNKPLKNYAIVNIDIYRGDEQTPVKSESITIGNELAGQKIIHYSINDVATWKPGEYTFEAYTEGQTTVVQTIFILE